MDSNASSSVVIRTDPSMSSCRTSGRRNTLSISVSTWSGLVKLKRPNSRSYFWTSGNLAAARSSADSFLPIFATMSCA